MSGFQLIQGDCRRALAVLPDESVHCVVTSPPYFGLRDYGTAEWEGGDSGCDHMMPIVGRNATSGLNAARNPDGTLTGKAQPSGTRQYADVCRKCGARRVDQQIGLEPTPDEYIAQMVNVMREVRRVLRKDGTLWLNIGDSYAGSWGARGRGEGTNAPRPDLVAKYGTDAPNRNVEGCKPKDLIGIPWMLAFALRADGWYLRSEIIWHKPNPMPESVTDRPTKAHEQIFLLTKSPSYFYDAEAIAERVSDGTVARYFEQLDRLEHQAGSARANGGAKTNGNMKAVVKRSGNKERKPATARDCPRDGVAGSVPWEGSTRNKRSVWTVTTKPFKDAHFATFPPDLIEPCILAGTSARGCCAQCGAPWERVVERSPATPGQNPGYTMNCTGRNDGDRAGRFIDHAATTLGWQPGCDCGADVVPCTVLDPFTGSGTTGHVAISHGRNFIGCELNPKYLAMARRRLLDTQPPLLLEA